MKKLILGILLLALIFIPIPKIVRYDCKVNCAPGISCECPRLPAGTQNLWDGYFLVWQKSIAQRLMGIISSQVTCIFNQCLSTQTLPIK